MIYTYKMECNESLIIITCIVYVVCIIILSLQLAYRVPYIILLTNITATATVLGFQMSSTCPVAFCTWGSITLAFLFMALVVETIDRCTV